MCVCVCSLLLDLLSTVTNYIACTILICTIYHIQIGTIEPLKLQNSILLHTNQYPCGKKTVTTQCSKRANQSRLKLILLFSNHFLTSVSHCFSHGYVCKMLTHVSVLLLIFFAIVQFTAMIITLKLMFVLWNKFDAMHVFFKAFYLYWLNWLIDCSCIWLDSQCASLSRKNGNFWINGIFLHHSTSTPNQEFSAGMVSELAET